MTKKEIALLFGYSEEFIHRIFRNAANSKAPIGINLKSKNNHSTKVKVIDYSLEECLFALHYIPATPMQIQYLKENFIKRDTLYENRQKDKNIKLSSKAKNFLWLYKHAIGKRHVCSTCAFLIARKPNRSGCKFAPYCNLFSRFINTVKPKIDIYNDKCEMFKLSNKAPYIFNEKGIANINFEGNIQHTTLGIPFKEFTTGASDEIILLRKIETDNEKAKS